MCGFFYSNDINVEDTKIKKYLHLRGPDSLNIYRDNECIYAHSRLIITGDNKIGEQPIIDKDINLLFNGEIYCFGKFKNEVASSCDTVNLLFLLKKYSFSEVISELTGMYSILLKRNNILHLARDYYGQKPLFYTINNNFIYISSSSKLIAHTTENYKLDHNNILRYFICGFVPENSVYSNVKEINNNTITEIDDCKIVEYPIKNNNNSMQGINNSIAISEPKNVNYGLQISGGIDSTAVACGLKNLNNVIGINIGSTNLQYDESKKAADTCKKLGIEYVNIIPSENESQNAIEESFKFLEEPICDSGIGPNYLSTKYCKDNNLKILLAGDGGDEIFGGYNRHALYSLKNSQNFKYYITKYFVKYFQSLFKHILPLTKYGAGNYKLRMKQLNIGLNANSLQEFYINALFSNFLPKKYLNLFYKMIPCNTDILKIDQSFYLKNNNLYRSDRITMGLGVELRSPLCNIIHSTSNYKFSNKRPLRKYIKSKLSDFKISPKKGFATGNSYQTKINNETTSFLNDIIGNDIEVLENSPHYRKRLIYFNSWFVNNYLCI